MDFYKTLMQCDGNGTGTRMTVVTTIALFTSCGRAKNVILCLLNVSDICDGLQLIEPILVSHSFIK